jgi:hypothetical protein
VDQTGDTMIPINRDGQGQVFIQWEQGAGSGGWKRAWVQHKTDSYTPAKQRSIVSPACSVLPVATVDVSVSAAS